MHRRTIFLFLAAGALMFLPRLRAEEKSEVPAWSASGTGGVHLYAEKGPLEITVFKRDRARGKPGTTNLHAVLYSPDRKLLVDEILSAAQQLERGGIPPWQKATIRTEVERPGLYLLQWVIPGDRYGTSMDWSITTNAKKWVVESARGHRDEAHREPIVMDRPEVSTDIVFAPQNRAFTILAEGLPLDSAPVQLFDSQGKEVAKIPVENTPSVVVRTHLHIRKPITPDGTIQFMVPAASKEGRGTAPWRLHFPQSRFFLEIGGVTEWDRSDRWQNSALWTPIPDSWFPLGDERWMISPYNRTTYATAGQEGEMTFRVHNGSPSPRDFALSLEFPTSPWDVKLPMDHVALKAGETKNLTLKFRYPAEDKAGKAAERIAYLRASPSDGGISTYASLHVREGKAPVGQALSLPMQLEPFQHENRQFGYLPDYPVRSQIYFDQNNKGFALGPWTLFRQTDHGWDERRLDQLVVRTVPESDLSGWGAESMGTKIAFDSENGVYLLANSGKKAALLHSADGGETFVAYLIEGREDEARNWDIEQFSGHNVPKGPPPVVRITRTSHPSDNPRLHWRSTNDVELIIPEKGNDGVIHFRDPIKLTQTALASSMHSGIPSMIVSRDSKVHIVWAEATDPEISREKIPGVPAWVATYDRDSGKLSKPVFMSFGPPPNDGHNTPSITMDSQGYLHVVVGTHGAPFQYLHSLKPNDSEGGWTEATHTGNAADLRQTYVGLVCGADDTLHLVYRLWLANPERWDGQNGANLTHQQKKKGGDWEAPQVLVAPAFSDYSVYYHRLTIDRKGRLFVNYDYWSTSWLYRNETASPIFAGSGRYGRGWGRSTIFSDDQGKNWRLW